VVVYENSEACRFGHSWFAGMDSGFYAQGVVGDRGETRIGLLKSSSYVVPETREGGPVQGKIFLQG